MSTKPKTSKKPMEYHEKNPERFFSQPAKEFFEKNPALAPSYKGKPGKPDYMIYHVTNDYYPQPSDSKEFPLPRDSWLLRKTLDEQMRRWLRPMAALLSRSDSARLLVSREQIYAASGVPELAWCLLQERLHRVPWAFLQKPISKLTRKVTDYFLAHQKFYFILVRE